jgi:hypothetical protein
MNECSGFEIMMNKVSSTDRLKLGGSLERRRRSPAQFV